MFRHVGISVFNLENMSKFYQDIFDLELMYDEVEEGEFLQKIVNQKLAEAHIHKLGKDENTIVELLKWKGGGGVNDRGLFENGVTHFALTVDSIDDVIKKYEDFPRNGDYHPPNVASNGKVKVMFCQDPEGNFIELVELLK